MTVTSDRKEGKSGLLLANITIESIYQSSIKGLSLAMNECLEVKILRAVLHGIATLFHFIARCSSDELLAGSIIMSGQVK